MNAGAADRLARLVALNADYARCIDDDRLEEWPGFFLERCLYKVTTADNLAKGYEAGLIYADSRACWKTASRRCARPTSTSASATATSSACRWRAADDAVETPFLVVRIMRDGKMDVFATGKYLDVVKEEKDELKFEARVVVCDSSRIDTLLAIPL